MSELLKVKLKDIKFFQTHMEISVPKRKNDQYREGHVVNILPRYRRFPQVRSKKFYCSLFGTMHIS